MTNQDLLLYSNQAETHSRLFGKKNCCSDVPELHFLATRWTSHEFSPHLRIEHLEFQAFPLPRLIFTPFLSVIFLLLLFFFFFLTRKRSKITDIDISNFSRSSLLNFNIFPFFRRFHRDGTRWFDGWIFYEPNYSRIHPFSFKNSLSAVHLHGWSNLKN